MKCAALQRPSSAAQCADWIKPAQLATYARAAADLALLACCPPAGEAFEVDGQLAADRADYAQYLADLFGLMVQAHAHRAGIAGFQGAADELERWQGALLAEASTTFREDTDV